MRTSLVTIEGSLCQSCSSLDVGGYLGSRSENPFDKFEFKFIIDVAASSLTCPLCGLTRRLVREKSVVFGLFRGDNITSTETVTIKKSHLGRTKLSCRWNKDFKEISTSLHDWQKDPTQVDFGPLKQKFVQCETEHGPTCRTKNRMPTEGLRVYNCLTNKLEEATIHTKYVALSYVWGSDPESSSQKPPEQCRTIRDAIQVVLNLGYKYLWVDQLCIDQSGAHKLQQIQQMNRIYQNAELTIVAAAGNNSDFGIPGVQDRHQLGRECFKIGNLQFIETLPNTHYLLNRTTWSSRAWTFQEEKLSHRLLVFTNRAAWFSCYLTGADRDYKAIMKQKQIPRPPCGLKMQPRFDTLISEYSKRFLTYPSDAVSAFSGILTALKEANFINSHVWGTPIMPAMQILLHPPRLLESGFARVERKTVDGFINGLLWETFDPEDFKPRHGIPSWSWAGWQGKIRFRNLFREGNVGFGIEVFIERTDGRILSWSEFEGLSYLENQSHLISRFIRLKAWTMDVRLEYHELPNGAHKALTSINEPSRYAVVRMLNGDEIRSEAVLLGAPLNPSTWEQFDELKYGECTGVCLFPIDGFSKSSRYVMLLHKVNGNLERIGFFMLGMFISDKVTTASGEVIDYLWKEDNGETSKLDISNYRAFGLNTRMEQIRIA